jgi:hypothetical protein
VPEHSGWAVAGAPAAGKKRKASDGLETEDGKGDEVEVEVEDARTKRRKKRREGGRAAKEPRKGGRAAKK